MKAKRHSVLPNAPPALSRMGPSSSMSLGGASGAAKDLYPLQFSIVHYAGTVIYTAECWLDKNRGHMRPELTFLMTNSDNTLVSSLMRGGGAAGGGSTSPDGHSNGSATSLMRNSSSSGARDGDRGVLKRGPATVLAAFRESLRALSATLMQTSARYIRCLKPNSCKSPGYFEGHFIARQLRYTGVSAVVEITRSGYPASLLKEA